MVADALRARDVEVESIRAVDLDIPSGVETELGKGDPWPAVHRSLLEPEILMLASPTWARQPPRSPSGPSSGWTRCCPNPTTMAVRPPSTGSRA
ncbi:hypothetical protein [Actinomadura mexicana]|uniref:hypothetical protein n=1 Tax=Actinomadura mexicana TaxID=134959 RepID=UPI001C52C478|nr:hypothetical protein [Actinomadura mexicana]